MPASNVTVSATFKVKTDAKYSVTYTAPTGEGVVDSSINPTETTLAAGTTVKVTVTVNEGYTASLAVDGATVTTSTSGNTYTFTFSMPAQNITVAPKVTKAGENTGTLIPNLYLIYSDSSSKPSDFTQYLNLYYNSDNQVYAYFDESNFDDSKEYCFMISNSKVSQHHGNMRMIITIILKLYLIVNNLHAEVAIIGCLRQVKANMYKQFSQSLKYVMLM